MEIASALAPFIPEGALSDAQLSQVSTYLDLLLKWNAKINLTSVRSRDEILTRHFGESFFLAHQLFGCHPERSEGPLRSEIQSRASHPNEPVPGSPALPAFGRAGVELSKSANQQMVIDLGSGAGFPGLPLKIYAPNLSVTLIESNQKKATFLREVIRVLRLTAINVFSSRAEDYVKDLSSRPSVGSGATRPLNERMSKSANEQMIVTLRAVEHFDRILPLAAQILTQKVVIARETRDLGFAVPGSNKQASPPRMLALLISSQQAPIAHRVLPHFAWHAPAPVPLSHSRILLLGHPPQETRNQERETSL